MSGNGEYLPLWLTWPIGQNAVVGGTLSKIPCPRHVHRKHLAIGCRLSDPRSSVLKPYEGAECNVLADAFSIKTMGSMAVALAWPFGPYHRSTNMATEYLRVAQLNE